MFAQLAEVILLWAIFLAFQLAKVSYTKCSLEWTLVYIGQAIFCLGTSAAFVSYQYHKMLDHPDNVDPELRAILTAGGHHDGHPDGELLITSEQASWPCIPYTTPGPGPFIPLFVLLPTLMKGS